MSSACSLILSQINAIFIRMVSRLDSLWNRGTRELGNGIYSVYKIAREISRENRVLTDSDSIVNIQKWWVLFRIVETANLFNAGSFASLSVVFSFKRRLEYFVSSVFSPAVTLVVLSWCCFWISRFAVPARVSLGITTILTAIVLFGSVNEAMPPVSYSKAQDYFLLVSFAFIFLSFLEFVIVLNTDPDPRWLQCLRRCFNMESDKVFIYCLAII